MILRKAELTDFEIFKKLFEDNDLGSQWLYYDFNSDKEKKEPTEEEKAKIELEFGDILKLLEEEYGNYTIERFEKDLSTSFIYMIEQDSEILGYISMHYHTNGRYKIAEWAMFNPKDEETKKEVVAALKDLELPRLREYSVCIANYLSVIFSMWDLGFRPTGSMRSGFWKLKVNIKYVEDEGLKFDDEADEP